ncbi:MAG: IS21 family transposase, partial [Acidobacteria bacterium]|nr:IS21 family transposase [Acidobacteriota bacterium]
SVRQIKEMLRLRYVTQLSVREIARRLKVSVGVVSKYLQLAARAGIGWPPPVELDEAALLAKLQPPAATLTSPFPALDFVAIHQELRRKDMTLQLLWEE